jgi:hypothetical protein
MIPSRLSATSTRPTPSSLPIPTCGPRMPGCFVSGTAR